MQFEIPSENVAGFLQKITKARKRVAKLGIEGEVIATELEELKRVEKLTRFIRDSDGEHHEFTAPVTIHTYEVSGPQPVLAGWSFVAAVHEIADTGNFMFQVVPDWRSRRGEFPEAELRCDHCKMQRRRKDVFLVHGEDGYKVVGRTCLKDFTGHKSPEQIAAYASFLSDIDNYLEEFSLESFKSAPLQGPAWNTQKVIEKSIMAIHGYGWRSVSKCEDDGGTPTKLWVREYLMGNVEVEYPGDVAKEACDVIEWVANVIAATPEPSDYEANLIAAVLSPYITNRELGIVVSAVPVYRRHLAKLQQDQMPKSEHVGEVKERLRDLALEVTFVSGFNGAYGWTSIYAMVREDGAVFKWFASDEMLERGDKIVIDGTVKAHGEYKGKKETTLTRCKVKRNSRYEQRESAR